FTSNVTSPGPEHDQVYVRLVSPPSSAPRTLKSVVGPLTGFAATLASFTIVGGLLGGAPGLKNHGVAVGSVVIWSRSMFAYLVRPLRDGCKPSAATSARVQTNPS